MKKLKKFSGKRIWKYMLFCLLAIVLEAVVLLYPGTAAASGNTGSLEPTELVVPHPSMKVTLHSAEFSCSISGGNGLKFESMDTSVFEVLERSTENTCWMKATGIGTAYMKVDSAANYVNEYTKSGKVKRWEYLCEATG